MHILKHLAGLHYSKCGPWLSSLCITQELARNAEPRRTAPASTQIQHLCGAVRAFYVSFLLIYL